MNKCYFYWLGYLYYLFNEQKTLHLLRFENLCTRQLTAVAFMVRDTTLNGVFSICTARTYSPYNVFIDLLINLKISM